MSSRADLAKLALRTSMRTRSAAGNGFIEPVCIWSLCEAYDLSVLFMKLGAEGLYVSSKQLVIVSSERPLPRRIFTGAHELGHHIFGHGSTLDDLSESADSTVEELLVNLFAGYVLMPPLAVRRAFVQRGLDPATAEPFQVYTIACSFGVGYTTLIDHMALSLGFINRERAGVVRRTSPKELREASLGDDVSAHMVVVDEFWSLPTIDVEVGDALLLPAGTAVSGDIVRVGSSKRHCKVVVKRPGIGQAYLSSGARFIRASRKHYEGLLRYRHLEDPALDQEEVLRAGD